MSVHTKGPWHSSDWGRIASSGNQHICTVATFSSKNGRANARLIAAAPELLEALMVAREWMRADKWRDSTVEKHASWEAVMRGIDAAIAKAAGAEGGKE